VAKYKGTDMTTHQIGKALGVGAVLEGSVRRVGNRVRVNAQLIDTRNDAHIWAEQYERDLTDVFAIQSDLALQIAAALHTSLSPDERARLEKRPTDDPEAYLTYLQARDEVSKGPQSIEELERIAQLYEKAIQLDPSFALAFAQLSYISATIYQAKNEPAALARARATASEALRLQPHLPEAHLALGYVYYRGDRDYERALSELAIAKQGLPNDPEVFLVTGSIERRQGRWRESTADFEKAASVNPKDPFLWNNLGTNYQALRDFPAAAKTFARGIEADPSFFPNQYMRARMEIDWNGDTTPLEELFQQTPAPPDPDGKITFARFELKRFSCWRRVRMKASFSGVLVFLSQNRISPAKHVV
jgi:tetratricopeptide (TPR) repeat protein